MDEYQRAELRRTVRVGPVKREPGTGVVYVAFDEAVINMANDAKCLGVTVSAKDVENLGLSVGDLVQVTVDLNSIHLGSAPTFKDIQSTGLRQFTGVAGANDGKPTVLWVKLMKIILFLNQFLKRLRIRFLPGCILVMPCRLL